MFLDALRRRNPALVEACVHLHQQGRIPPNTVVIDVDTVRENARHLVETAAEQGMALYFMTKQFGRDSELSREIAAQGLTRAVAVDLQEARRLSQAGIRVGHVGHLVQPGKHEWPQVLQMEPEVVTLFSLERARQLSQAAQRMGRVQGVMLRVVKEGDRFYPGQRGGFSLADLHACLPELLDLAGIRVEGVTSFPVAEAAAGKGGFRWTPNLQTLLEGKAILEQAGVEVKQVNGPGMTSCALLPFLKQRGVTHGEPGHALTGTTPLHAGTQNLPERPALAYVTEISHRDGEHLYVIGGGFYSRSRAEGAWVGSTAYAALKCRIAYHPVPPGTIDYYGALQETEGVQIGDTAVFCFRTQVFVTRAHLALLYGVGRHPIRIRLLRRG
ncbi:MAG: alanine racemase [Firmicutes bacterium]|uniref:Predicted amino acid racemase n=1 Tax=Melghirimyces thermohalophilus TaxID=1236220 RepID=A0A1G6KUW4_9BACL|nr:alanine racemase [Melghirimyces thermohalophilus]MDA8353322.1 alanine racemase [Bacillota bacterium]SDC34717.1 Predicted amino acid racemase [Melghirimyces thermohalophilus]